MNRLAGILVVLIAMSFAVDSYAGCQWCRIIAGPDGGYEEKCIPIPCGLQVTGVVAESEDNGTFLSWDPNPNAEWYAIYWDTDPDVTQENSNKIDEITDTQFIHENVPGGQTIYYAIVAATDDQEAPITNIVSAILPQEMGDVAQISSSTAVQTPPLFETSSLQCMTFGPDGGGHYYQICWEVP